MVKYLVSCKFIMGTACFDILPHLKKIVIFLFKTDKRWMNFEMTSFCSTYRYTTNDKCLGSLAKVLPC